jgi:hypothetical protein
MEPVPEITFASDARHDPAGEAETARIESSKSDILFWVGAGLGTVPAGGMFGFLLEGFAGFVYGTLCAAMFSIPMQFSAAVVSWALWLSRFRIGFAILAGILTGIWATVITVPTSLYGSIAPLATLAGILGALGAGIVTSWMTFKTAVGLELHAAAKLRKWQFSLGGLFLRFAVICVLLALWTLAVRAILNAREASRIEQEEIMRQGQGSPD